MISFLRVLLILFWAVLVANSAYTQDEDVRLHVEDGQVKKLPFRIFVINKPLEGKKPLLWLEMKDLETEGEREDLEPPPWKPLFVSDDQTLVIERDGAKTTEKGTLMVFDLDKMHMKYWQTMRRVTPILEWEEDGARTKITNMDEVSIGYLPPAMVYVTFLCLIMCLILGLLSKQGSGSALALLCDKEGYLSLSRLQMGSWTLAVGGVVLIFGLIFSTVPDIPNTLVALMGISLATSLVKGMVGGDETKEVETEKTDRSMDKVKPKLFQLIANVRANGQMVFSLPKAQMLFWTIINIGIFIFKSIEERKMWEVPEQMVILMGMSQATYVTAETMGKGGKKKQENNGTD